MKIWLFLLAVTIMALLAGCIEKVPDPVPATTVRQPTASIPATETPMDASPFRVIAYVTASVVPEIIPYERLTHINYAFLIPKADGSFAHLSNGWKLEKIVAEAHEADIQVLISVGGWGWDDVFERMAADPETRNAFVNNLAAFVEQYDLDGADIDWEYPDPGESSANFVLLIQELREVMPDKLLTTAVVSYGATGDGIASETFELFDFVNVMTYEGPDHGTMEQFQKGMAYWQGRGLEPEKTVMGVPFYGEPGGAIYRKIVEADPTAAERDETDYWGAMVHYNGRPTIAEKTRLAMENGSGIMFWTLEHDAMDELSLLKVIDDVVKQSE